MQAQRKSPKRQLGWGKRDGAESDAEQTQVQALLTKAGGWGDCASLGTRSDGRAGPRASRGVRPRGWVCPALAPRASDGGEGWQLTAPARASSQQDSSPLLKQDTTQCNLLQEAFLEPAQLRDSPSSHSPPLGLGPAAFQTGLGGLQGMTEGEGEPTGDHQSRLGAALGTGLPGQRPGTGTRWTRRSSVSCGRWRGGF